MDIPVFIPSKGRPNPTTARMLEGMGFTDYTIFVEPQDESLYAQTTEKLFILDKNDQGLAYVRNFILKFAAEREIPFYWMLDDDISGIGYQNKLTKRNKRFTKNPFPLLNKYVSGRYAQLALEYEQYSWNATRDFHYNQYCDVFVCMNTKLCYGAEAYDKSMVPKEDREFTLKLRKRGLNTIRLARYCFDNGGIGSRKGGLEKVYKKSLLLPLMNVVEKHKGLVEIVDKRGQLDLKFHWNRV